MEIFISVVLILGALLAGAVSPGPSFVLVARTAMGMSRNDGVAAAIGMGTGSVLFAAFALMGLQALLTKIPMLYFGLKICGGIYLLYLAFKIWTGAKRDFIVSSTAKGGQTTLTRSFFVGLVTQLSNPKTALVYAGIFAALLPGRIPLIIYFILPPLIFLLEAGWYIFVALMLSSALPRTAYLKTKSIFDKIAACAMAGLGLKLMSDVYS